MRSQPVRESALRTITKRRSAMLLPAGLLVAIATGGAMAQSPVAGTPVVEEAVQLRPATLALEPPGGGTPHEYKVEDASIAVSQTYDGRSDTRADVSMSLSQVHPVDPFLLDWIRQGGDRSDASRKVVFTVPPRQSSEKGAEMRYEMEGAKVSSFSASHSASSIYEPVAIQVFVKRLSLNGIALN